MLVMGWIDEIVNVPRWMDEWNDFELKIILLRFRKVCKGDVGSNRERNVAGQTKFGETKSE